MKFAKLVLNPINPKECARHIHYIIGENYWHDQAHAGNVDLANGTLTVAFDSSTDNDDIDAECDDLVQDGWVIEWEQYEGEEV